ncbi:Putative peroxiredoxin bcp [Rhodobacteraceae bacterium THAF1]|uniref:peroxiredoxin n=1 Tax=Palleronia sp. THAF1 TaxID=2587842 RepID=UPI000F3FB4D6|nr:peroxiredoxin [Palleronia sp. THAF1]QFU09465.1 Putative peroxiredoxin bcp [Palleronia sp. THAF1]VDC21857.1 Putative peroxiredoxin bcp [Rhodobacteraceae bacterium THAF1]
MSDVNWAELPQPEDDGAADHVKGLVLPDWPLPSTDGADISMGVQTGRIVVFCYPMTGRPDHDLPDGWNEIPGARGCSPQACSYRDLSEDLKAAGVDRIFGLSTQHTDWQAEAKERLGLPYPLLSDHGAEMAEELDLPRFEVDGTVLLKRMTMIVDGGTVTAVHYPVFPPDQDAQWVLDQLR